MTPAAWQSAIIDLLLAHPQWRDRIGAPRIGAFGAGMGGESTPLMAGAGLRSSRVLRYLAISGAAHTKVPIAAPLQRTNRLAGSRELVALVGVTHGFDVASTNDIFTRTMTLLVAEVRGDPAALGRLLGMTSVAGEPDVHRSIEHAS